MMLIVRRGGGVVVLRYNSEGRLVSEERFEGVRQVFLGNVAASRHEGLDSGVEVYSVEGEAVVERRGSLLLVRPG